MDKHYLNPLFLPESIVVFAGPPDDTTGQAPQARIVHAALREQPFAGSLQFLDIHTSGTLADLAHTRADLAVIALPPPDVAAALDIAGRIGCRTALVISSGIDAERAAELKAIARREGMHLLGPNCLGIQRPHLQLNASAAGPMARAGSLALVSQSGALTSSMLDWAQRNAVGFSTVVSLGPNTGVDIAQVLDFLAHDGRTQSIIVYLEGISSARRFMSALRSAANAKPVVVLKAGRRPAGNEAAQTHSGAIVGSDDVFDAALRRAGAVRVRSFVELFSAAKCLASRSRPVGRQLAIVTNGGGPGVLAADWVNEIHLQLGRLSSESAAALKPLLPPLATLTDLIDLSEEARAEHYHAAIEAAGHDRQVDGVLVIFSPKVGVDATEVARQLVALKAAIGKPLLACWMGDASVTEARALLNEAAIPSFRTPEAAVGAFGNIASFYQNQRLLQQTPPPDAQGFGGGGRAGGRFGGGGPAACSAPIARTRHRRRSRSSRGRTRRKAAALETPPLRAGGRASATRSWPTRPDGCRALRALPCASSRRAAGPWRWQPELLQRTLSRQCYRSTAARPFPFSPGRPATLPDRER